MKAIYLPLVSDKMTVGDAVERLITSRKVTDATTVVTTRGNKPAILNGKDLVRLAQADPKQSVAEVAVAQQGTRLSGIGLGIVLDQHSAQIVEPMLAKAGVIFGVVPGGGKHMVHVITKEERHASLFTGAWTICQCTGPGRHIVLAGKLTRSGCNICGHPVNCG